MATETIKLKYISVERFLRDYAQLRKGRLALPVKSPLPLHTRICLKVNIPDIEPVLILKGTVIKNFAPLRTSRLPKAGFMRIGFNGDSQNTIKNFDNILRRHEKYREPLDLPVPGDSSKTDSPEIPTPAVPAAHSGKCGALSVDWLRTALAPKITAASKGNAAQYRADTVKMVTDVRTNVRSYINRILRVKTTGEAIVLLKLFRRILPNLTQMEDWSTVLYLTRAVDQAAKTTVFFAAASGLPANPLEFVFVDRKDDIVRAYATADATQRIMINDIAARLDAAGIEIIARALSTCTDDRVHKAAMSILVKKGALVRNWILAVLDAPGQKWYLKRTALMLLKYVGQKEEEIDRARKLVTHDHPRVREEALNVLITLQALGAEKLIIAALNDADNKVRRQAMSCLTRLSPISERVIYHLLSNISVATKPNKKEAVRHYRKISLLIKALGAAADIANHTKAENIMLTLVRKLSYRRLGAFRRLKKSIDPDQSDVLSAAITTLGKIGTDKSESFLEKLAGSKSPQAQSAQAAANHIKLRYIAMLSTLSADADMPTTVRAERPVATTKILAASSKS